MVKKVEVEPIELRPLTNRILKMKIVGVTTLNVHRLSEKLRKEMEDRDAGKPKKTKKGIVRDIEAEFLESLYYLDSKGCGVEVPKKITSKSRFGFPASGFKKSMIAACRYYDNISMVSANGLFFVEGEYVEIKGTPVIDKFWRRIGGKSPGTGTPDIGVRAKFLKWTAELSISFGVDAISAASVTNLLATAGERVGIGEDRPGKSGNNFGKWRVVLN